MLVDNVKVLYIPLYFQLFSKEFPGNNHHLEQIPGEVKRDQLVQP